MYTGKSCLSCTCSMCSVKNCIDWIILLLNTVTDQDIDFLVPDSCGVKVRNSRGHHQKRLKQCLFLLYLDNLAVVLSFLTFKDLCSVHEEITSIRLYTPCNPRSCETGHNLFLKLVQINIFSNNICILSIHSLNTSFSLTSSIPEKFTALCSKRNYVNRHYCMIHKEVINRHYCMIHKEVILIDTTV
jgi:hypothetical protein